MTVKTFILYPLEDSINRHQSKSLNMRRNLRAHWFYPVNIYQRRNRARYQKRKQCSFTLFLVNLPYSIKKEIIIHVYYFLWHQNYIIWVINLRQNISLIVSRIIFWGIHNIGRTHFCRDILMGYHRLKTEIDSIIVLRNGIHPLHMIYFEIRLLIQLCVCY